MIFISDFGINQEQLDELGIFLKKLRENKGYSLGQVEAHTNLNKKEIFMLEKGQKKKPNPMYLKTLANFYKINVLELFEKIGFVDEKYKSDPRIQKLNKREKIQLNEIVSGANLFFNDNSVNDEDKKKLIDSLQELYFDAKLKNKRK